MSDEILYYIGDSDREISLTKVISELINTKLAFSLYTKRLKLDESEAEELQALLAGEIEQCTKCNEWVHSYNIDTFGHCTACNDHQDIGIYLSNQYN